MEQLNSGINSIDIYIKAENSDWIKLEEVCESNGRFFREAASYKWKYITEKRVIFKIEEESLSAYLSNNERYGEFTLPFHTGNIIFQLLDADNPKQQLYLGKSFVYSDERKLSQKDFEKMIEDINEIANVCFGYTGLKYNFSIKSRSQDNYEPLWSYIEEHFSDLQLLFRSIENAPKKQLKPQEQFIKIHKVRKVNNQTNNWIDKYEDKYGKEPRYVRTSKATENYNTFENRIIKFQLIKLKALLNVFARWFTNKKSDNEQEKLSYSNKAKLADKYGDLVSYWLKNTFLFEVTSEHIVPRITQVFRKDPLYRKWWLWFDELYKNEKYNVNTEGREIPLTKTYDLYEIWTFMKILKVFEQNGLINDTSSLYIVKREGIFFNLARNKDCVVELNNGWKLTYQKTFRWDTTPYKSFTQKMIPDIVLDTGEKMIVLDAKYRVQGNLGNALSELHKYRDGIVEKRSNKRIVREAYILAPRTNSQRKYNDGSNEINEEQEGINFKEIFSEVYRKEYKMGAFEFMPFGNLYEFENWLDDFIRNELHFEEVIL
ncbi:DUF2357 domain-containing protein [Clostridium sp. BL-8]|uniref:DUF2357 domain-containing protein n=1 Tax=Clostridium sp. BL-8 TaxID=349938 RepID=UPI00098C074B|nr:DUF2357 domain-containing protein [Clostridium sp. BL-8]OOM78809.1 hypothetical protein CLOBL_20570 [Clostridium sp. BL-8]